MELSGVLDTGGSSSDNDHVHQSVDLGLGLSGEGGRLDAVHELGSNLVRVGELLEEARVLGHTGHAERLVLASDSVHEVVVRDGLL